MLLRFTFEPCRRPALQCAGHRAQASRLRAERGHTFFRRGGPRGDRAGSGHELGLVQLVVAADQNDDRLAVGDVNQRLDLAVGRNFVRFLAQRFDGDDAGRGEFFNGRADFARGGFGNAAGGLLDVRRVTAGFAEDDFVLAGLGGHHEFVREIAADDAGVGLHRKRLQSAPGKDARVGIKHFFVAGHRAVVRGVERIGVFHDEFLRAHEAEARADFIAEFHADLVEVLGQLPVGIDFVGGDGGDDLLGRGAENPFAVAAVLQFEQHVAGGFVTAGLLPDFRRLEGGHEQFERAGAVHFLADDLLHLAQRAQAERQEGIDAAGELADQPGAEQEFVGKDFRVSRSFAEGRNKCIGPLHVAERLTTKERRNEEFYFAA